MIKLKQAVIVEGKYDKIRLNSLIDATIITTEGFGVFRDSEKKELIRLLAKKRGIIILTDSDMAGFKIRSYIKGLVKEGKITNVYIPDIFGKERRKSVPSKEGKLGVEGMPENALKQAFQKAGISFDEENFPPPNPEPITKSDFFDLGLTGTPNSSEKRCKLKKKLNLPERLSTNSLLEIVNIMYKREDFLKEFYGIF